MELSAEQFEAMKADLAAGNGTANVADPLEDLKYAGKNEVQINFIKQMEASRNKRQP
jgi:hypothetical protein